MLKLKRLTLVEEHELWHRMREFNDTTARDQLVMHTYPLIHWVARKYRRSHIEYADLEQQGALGLILAAERWEVLDGFSFSTFARWWIMQMVHRFVVEQHPVRIPSLNRAYGMQRAIESFRTQHGREPTIRRGGKTRGA